MMIDTAFLSSERVVAVGSIAMSRDLRFACAAMMAVSGATALIGCGSGSNGPAEISVSLSPSTASVPIGGAVHFTAKVRNATNASVSWTLSGCAGGDCGAIVWGGGFDQLHSEGIYIAPSAPQAATIGSQLTVTATSIEDNTTSASASITLMAAAVDFSPPDSIAIGRSPVDVVTGDVNGDGMLDIATADRSDASILLGNGDGTLQPATHFPAGTHPMALTAADLNRDGRTDLVVVDFGDRASGGNGNLNLLLGRGDATFRLPAGVIAQDQEFRADSLTVGDFNHDGVQDVVVAEGGDRLAGDNGGVALLMGNGDGTLKTPVRFAAGENPVGVVASDFNGDAKLDVAVGSREVSVLLGDGAGTFRPAISFPVSYRPTSIAAGDLNGDAKPDLAVSAFGSTRGLTESAFSTRIDILVGTGNGQFERQAYAIRSALKVGKPPMVFPPAPRSLRLEDFNGDGNLDIAEINVEPRGSVCIVLGNGDGTLWGEKLQLQTPEFVWQGRLLFPGGTDAAALAIGDLNSDGRPDIVVANPAQSGIRVLLNTSGV